MGLRRFIVAVSRRGLFVEDFVECAFGSSCEVEFLVPERPGGLGDTVQALAAAAGESELEALIGVHYFPELSSLRGVANAAVEAGKRTEMAAILERITATSPIRVERAGDWLDCGNPDRHASSHRALLQERDFDELEVDWHLGLITKRSRNVEKFVDEINFLRLPPPRLRVLFPRLVDFSTDWQRPHLTQEYYGYPNLADAFVFESLDPGLWERVFQHLLHILTKSFASERRPLPAGAVEQMYLGKIRQRLADLNGRPSSYNWSRLRTGCSSTVAECKV